MDTKSNNITSKKQANHRKLQDKNMQKLHVETLGLDIPKNYFSKSRQDILSKVSGKVEHKKSVFFLKKPLAWYAAASVMLLMTLTFIKSNNSLQMDDIHTIVSDTINSLDENKFENQIAEFTENDILITSLFIEENKIDEFIDNYVLDEALIDDAL